MTDPIDKRIKKLIISSVKRNHRSLFTVLGPQSLKQVPVFYNILQQKIKQVSVLWCSNKSFVSFKQCNTSQLEGWQNLSSSDTDDSSSLYYCSYSEIERITHCTFNLAVFGDVKALNLQTLTSVIQAVRGGGAILFLLPAIEDLEELNSLDLNSKVESSRFSSRFSYSLSSCPGSMILDDSLSILSTGPKIPQKELTIDDNLTERQKIEDIKLQNKSDAVVCSLLNVCRTSDQAEMLVKFLDAIKKRAFHSVISVSSPTGRGKSTALGLAIAGGLAFNYSNIFVSSLCYKNVNTVFKFVLKGLDVLDYKEDKDFDLIESINPKFKNALMGINIFRDHPQSVRFISPFDIGQNIDQAELVVFDEAAAIPLQILKKMTSGPYVVLMASSISGCGSSSPYLYDSMIKAVQPSGALSSGEGQFQDITLNEPVNYAAEDCIETWINRTLCLEPKISPSLACGFPIPEQCRLFCVSRDTLFRGSDQVEEFLQSLVSLLSSSKTALDPDHLLEIADSPDYHIFCLLPPVSNVQKSFSDIICAVLVHVENEIPDNITHCGTNILGGLVPNCFNQWRTATSTSSPGFLPILGIHILNIVTHQSYRKMGYGSRALQLLQDFYEGKCIDLDEHLEVEGKVSSGGLPKAADSRIESSLLQQLTEIQPEEAHFVLVSCNLSSESLRFWKKVGYIPAFISEKTNSEEYTLFMVKSISTNFKDRVERYWYSFQDHYCTLMGTEYRGFNAALALNLLHFNKNFRQRTIKELTKMDIDLLICPHKMKLLEKYCQNLQDFHTIMQFIPTLATLFFKSFLKDVELSRVQEAILLSFGLQYKTVDDISKDLSLPNMQIYGLLNRALKRIGKYLTEIIEKGVERTFQNPDVVMTPIEQGLDDELEEAAKKIKEQQAVDALKLKDLDVSQYAIKGSEDDWQKVLFTGRKALVSIKSLKTKIESSDTASNDQQNFKKHKQQKNKRKR